MGDLRRLRGTHRRRNQAPPAATSAPGPGSSNQKALLPGALMLAGRSYPSRESRAYILGASAPSLHLLNQGPHCSRFPEIAQTKSTWTGTFRENGLWHGRSPGKTQDLPGKWPLAWKVPRKNAGPSRKTGSGMEGPPEKGRTFQENGLRRGRSPGKRQDLPGKRPLAWKVLGQVSCESRKRVVFRNRAVNWTGQSTESAVFVDGIGE